MTRPVVLALVVVALLYCGIGAALLLFQRTLVYMNDTTDLTPSEAGLSDVAVHRLTTIDGVELVAWLAHGGRDRLVIYFHGNGGALASRAERIKQWTDLNLSVLAIDYRGFGGSGGKPSEIGLKTDADAAYDFARTLGYAPAQILLYGESLGTGVAVALASHRQVAGVILDSAYSSIADVAADRYWMFPVRLLLRDTFQSDALIGRIDGPILMLHGTDDDVVPIRFGQKLFAKAGPKATFVALPDDDHLVFGNPDAVAIVKPWIETVFGPH